MSSFGSPPMPARMGALATDMVDIYTMTPGIGDGYVGTGTMALAYSEVPCSFQTMSSSERQRYGAVTEDTLYLLFLPVLSSTGADILVVGDRVSWQFQIDGVRYAAVSGGELQGDGMQKVALRRVGTV